MVTPNFAQQFAQPPAGSGLERVDLNRVDHRKESKNNNYYTLRQMKVIGRMLAQNLGMKEPPGSKKLDLEVFIKQHAAQVQGMYFDPRA
jgi:hypothetical protein